MKNRVSGVRLLFFAALSVLSALCGHAREAGGETAERTNKVVVIPVREQISNPELYILRRGMKEAVDQGVDTIVLDMDTPGGALNVTFEMLKALEKFPGKTVTYINSEAISAGALIAAGTDDIYFAPGGVIGAAAPVLATGQEINETMQGKIVSYLKARVRAISEDKGYRGEVISAMIDMDYELKIDEVVIKEKGELLSLTAREAMKEYGDPPQPLLAAGIAENIETLLNGIHGDGNWTMTRLEVTWSEKAAQYLTSIAPLLMAAGMVLLFIEFKTPGFGIFGILGGVVLAVVFFGHYVAGLSGHEPALFFALGVALVLVEIFLLPGTIVFAVTGGLLMLGSLVWSMADLWPDQPVSFTAEVFYRPLRNVATGVVLALVIFFALLRFLPQGGLWGKMVLEAEVRGASVPKGIPAGQPDSLVGRSGVAVTALYPSGQVEVDGKRHEARLIVGYADAGTPVVVVRQGEFSLEVEVAG